METSQTRVTRAVKKHLSSNRMSASELARQIGMPQPAISRRLAGLVSWSLDDIDMLTLAGVEMPWLLLDAEAVAP